MTSTNIPSFPNFKNIEWSDKPEVEKITSQFPPYSDFNFISLWAWNTQEKMKLSLLNENLVVMFHDYVTEQPFLSFIGKSKVDETASALIEYSEQNFKAAQLKLIPEETAKLFSHDFIVTPNEDAHDYIIPVAYLATLPEYPSRSHHAARDCKLFLRDNSKYEIVIQSSNKTDKELLKEVFKRWSDSKSLKHIELNEYKAYDRLLNNRQCENTIHSIFIEQQIIGFETLEIVSHDYAIGHFCKADRKYRGVYDFILHACGKYLSERGIKYFNLEQDLGIEGLRNSKLKYKPPFYLKKFIVEKK